MAFLQKITLSNFRNFENLDLAFSSGINVLVGENGQGKTNIIESIYLLTKGESFRFAKNIDLILKNKEASAIKASFFKNNLQKDIILKLYKDKKKFELNNKTSSFSIIQKDISSVLFSPESLSVIKGNSEERRKLIDDILKIKSLRNFSLIKDYKKTLRSRNRLLKDLKKEVKNSDLLKTLEAVNEIFLNLGTDLSFERLQIIEEIKPYFEESMDLISGEKGLQVSVGYSISGEDALDFKKSDIYDALCCKLSKISDAEQALGSSLIGPHKHDVDFFYNNENSRTFCSQGQQRTLILALKFAQVLYYYKIHGDYPIILLDDVLSELDEQKKTNLINLLRNIDSQIFLTATDISFFNLFKDSQLKVFKVKSSEVVPLFMEQQKICQI